MNNFLRLLTILSFFTFVFICNQQTYGQLNTYTGYTATELAESLVGTGVTVSGATLSCGGSGGGMFGCVDCSVSIDSGIILTSGTAADAEGPNNSSAITGVLGTAGDPDLNSLIPGYSTHDACVLEFDVDVKFDTLKFDYVFGSDEYLEWVGTSFNDVFGFFISGPGITGSPNIALIPGTTTPVSINNVNSTSYSTYYVNNGDGFTAPYSTDAYYIQYDGFTTVLQAKEVVTPCETYHLKLAVADAGDDILDSGVFIKAGSLTSYGIDLVSETSVGFGFENAIEGCVDGYIILEATTPPSDTLTFAVSYGGTATAGTDYPSGPDSLTISPTASSDTIFITPLLDGLTEGTESVTVYLLNGCDGTPFDSVTLDIQDYILLEPNIYPDTTICQHDTLMLSASGGIDYFWAPGISISSTFGDTVYVYPDAEQIYEVTTFLGTCSETDSVTVHVNAAPTVNLADQSICLGDSYQFWIDPCVGCSYSWTPPGDLDVTNTNAPTASPTAVGSTDYIATVSDAIGCTTIDTVTLTVSNDPVVDAGPDTVVCSGLEVQLFANGGATYFWYPSTGLTDPAAANPIATVTDTITYHVVITDATGCDDTVAVFIDVQPYPIVDAGPLTVIYEGESTTLDGSSTEVSNLWSPASSLSDSTILNPVATPDESVWYYLTATSLIGCQTTDSVHVVVVQYPAFEIPSAFSPNEDGLNDILHIIAFENIDLTSFQIWDRWGKLVFQTDDVNIGWDGKFAGKEQEIGTYIYLFVGIDEKGKQLAQQGTINLLR